MKLHVVTGGVRAGRPGVQGQPGPAAPEIGGVARWIVDALRAAGLGRAGSPAPQKQMQVLETLALGNRRELMLVSCHGERFLVGMGPSEVQTIVPVRPETTLAAVPLQTGTQPLARYGERR